MFSTRPFWQGQNGLDFLLLQRYGFLRRSFSNARLLFVTPTQLKCPLAGSATIQIPRRLLPSDVREIRRWCERNKISIYYSLLDCVAGIIEHLDGLKICEISDVWHLRAEAFAKYGYAHGSDREAELRSMRSYDLILALNSQEVEYLHQNGVEHARQFLPPMRFEEVQSGIKMHQTGMISATNKANIDALLQLSPLLKTIDSFLLAGSICHTSEAQRLPRDTVMPMGTVQDPRDFYKEVETVVSPVRFGAGLKMKVLEAVARGKPVLASEYSVDGYPEGIRQVVSVGGDISAWSVGELQRSKEMHRADLQRDYIECFFSDAALSASLSRLI